MDRKLKYKLEIVESLGTDGNELGSRKVCNFEFELSEKKVLHDTK